MNSSLRGRVIAVATALVVVLVGGCQTTPTRKTAMSAPNGAVDPEDYLPVDCLLPGQVRRIGNTTYLTPRRPVRTSAIDCRIRGGEYVAYDRADYRWALKVWLEAAKQGDPEAQTYVGEIYERGIDGRPDYRQAIEWYRKAAEQGYRRAMRKLGYFYEKGLGVPQDPVAALNWYRRAAGLEEDGLMYATQLRAEVARQVRLRLSELERRLADYRRQAARLRQALQETKRRLNRLGEGADAPLRGELERRLAEQERALQASLRREKRLRALLEQKSEETRILRRQLESRRKALAEAEARLQQARAELDSLYARLETTRSSDAARARELEQAIDERERRLAELRDEVARLDAEARQLRRRLASGQEEVALPGPSIEIVRPLAVVTRDTKPRILYRENEAAVIVGEVEAPAGLDRLLVNGRPVAPDEKGRFRIRLDRVRPNMDLRIQARDALAREAVLEFTLVPEPPPARDEGDFAGLEFGRYFALVIGNNDYRHLPPLKSAAQDAQAVHDLLVERYGFRSRLLLDATREQIIAALGEMQALVGEKDNLLIYYAGHGKLVEGRGYWLPVDAEPDEITRWIPNSTITDLLEITKARHVMVVADSCYSGSLSGMAVPRPLQTAVTKVSPRWVKAMLKRRSRTVLTSGGLKPVLDVGKGRHSVFARAFLDALQGSGSLMDGYRLYQRIVEPVRQEALRFGLDQTPTYAAILGGGGISGEFFFVPRTGALADAAVPEWRPADLAARTDQFTGFSSFSRSSRRLSPL